jgi:hypothetical protein
MKNVAITGVKMVETKSREFLLLSDNAIHVTKKYKIFNKGAPGLEKNTSGRFRARGVRSTDRGRQIHT